MQDTDASTWEFSEDIIPNIKAQADRSVRNDVYCEPGEEGPIPPVHEGGLASHLGLTHAEIIQNATIVPSLARACPTRLLCTVFLSVLQCRTLAHAPIYLGLSRWQMCSVMRVGAR